MADTPAAMARIATLTLLVLSAATVVRAQSTLVIPPSAANVEASGFTNVPFGRSVPMRTQSAYENLSFQGPVTITALGYRLDENVTTTGKSVDLEVHLSTLAQGIVAIRDDYAANIGVDAATVFQRRLHNLPPHSAPGRPNPFHLQIPLDQSFRYLATPGTALLVDVLVHGQPPGNVTLDATFLCDSPQTNFGPAGCGPSGGRPLAATSLTNPLLWGRTFALGARDARAQAATAMLLGSRENGSYAGLPLPIDLTPLGAPGCALATDPFAVFSKLADATGGADYTFVVPSIPYLVGTTIRFQAAALDPTANALGVVTSQGGRATICGWEPVARVYGTTVTATTGARELGVAPVLSLTIH
jgi:hypothetical protein